MVSPVVFTLLVCLAIANAQLDPFVKIDTPFKITPLDFIKSHFIQPDTVYGAKDCGILGQTGEITQFLHNNCLSGLPAITCISEIEKPHKGSVYFVPREDAKGVVVHVSIIRSDGETKEADIPLPDTVLTTGHPYELTITGNIERDLLGRMLTAKIEVLKESGKSVLACAALDILAYKGDGENVRA